MIYLYFFDIITDINRKNIKIDYILPGGNDAMRIIKGVYDTTPKKIIFTDEIDSFYQEYSEDYLNFYNIQTLHRIEKENSLLFLDIINETKNLQTSGNINELSYVKIKKCIGAYLSNTQSLLNSLERLTSKAIFKQITNTIHSNHIEYQLCYELRNIEQHGNFNNALSISIEKGKVCILIDKNKMIENYNLKEKHKSLLDLFPEKIDLIEQLNAYYNCQLEIINWLFIDIYNDEQQQRLLTIANTYAINNILYVADDDKITYATDGKELRTLKFLQIDIDDIIQNIDLYKNHSFRTLKLGDTINYKNFFEF